MAISVKETGISSWLWARSGVLLTVASLKLVYGATGWDVGRSRTEIKTATQTNLGSTGSNVGFKTHGNVKISCLDFDGPSTDFTAFWSKYDWLSAFNSGTKVPLSWGLAPTTGVCAASTILESASFTVLSVSDSYSVDSQVKFDVTLGVDGDFSTYTTT